MSNNFDYDTVQNSIAKFVVDFYKDSDVSPEEMADLIVGDSAISNAFEEAPANSIRAYVELYNGFKLSPVLITFDSAENYTRQNADDAALWALKAIVMTHVPKAIIEESLAIKEGKE